MDHFIGELTGLAFVIFIFGGGIISSALKAWERRMELQAQRQQGMNDEVRQELASLRAEIAGLRDTSTQFDISLEQTVHRLEQRMAHLETPGAAQSARTSPDETPYQPLGRS